MKQIVWCRLLLTLLTGMVMNTAKSQIFITVGGDIGLPAKGNSSTGVGATVGCEFFNGSRLSATLTIGAMFFENGSEIIPSGEQHSFRRTFVSFLLGGKYILVPAKKYAGGFCVTGEVGAAGRKIKYDKPPEWFYLDNGDIALQLAPGIGYQYKNVEASLRRTICTNLFENHYNFRIAYRIQLSHDNPKRKNPNQN